MKILLSDKTHIERPDDYAFFIIQPHKYLATCFHIARTANNEIEVYFPEASSDSSVTPGSVTIIRKD